MSCIDKEWVIPSFYTHFVYPEVVKGNDKQISLESHFSQECLNYLFPTSLETYAELKEEFKRKQDERHWYDFFGARNDFCYKPLFAELNQHLPQGSNSHYEIRDTQTLATMIFEMMKYAKKIYAPKDSDPPCSTISNFMYKAFSEINQKTSIFSEIHYFYIRGSFLKYRDDQGKIQNTNWMYHVFLSVTDYDGQTMIIDPFSGVIPIEITPDEWVSIHYVNGVVTKTKPNFKDISVNWRAGQDFSAGPGPGFKTFK